MRSGLLLLFLCASAFAEVTEIRNCLYHEGDDPAWARSDYDDNGWLAAVPNPPTSPYIWARCSVTIPQPVDGPLHFQPQRPPTGWERIDVAWILYVNGVRVTSYGNPETGRVAIDLFREVVLPRDAGTGPLKIAVRFARRLSVSLGVPLGVVGSKTDLELRLDRKLMQNASRLVVPIGFSIVQLGVAVMLLTLSLSGRTHRGAILLGILALANPLDNLPTLFILAGVPVPLDLGQTVSILARAFPILYPFFAYSILGRKTPRFFRYGVAVVLALHLHALVYLLLPQSPTLIYQVHSRRAVQTLSNSVWIVYLCGLVTALLPWRTLRRREKWLLLPNAALCSAYAFWIYALTLAPAYRDIGYVAVTSVGVAFDLFYAVLIAFRFRRVNDEHRSLTDEMHSAREVQRRLVPEVSAIAGFRIDAAYVPAKEVGGDFYQLLPGDDGSLLVVVGDVSGKGLDAAMVVAVAVGALGSMAVRTPGPVLTGMNRALLSKTRGGFVTCCCALFRADGTVEIANAGHIPPYLRGCELEIAPGPPLGIFEDAAYEAATVSSGAAAITFLSDGVVEAKNGAGELLGFDRLAGLSVKPAREIAKEAERWGQEDDITVVRVAYA